MISLVTNVNVGPTCERDPEQPQSLLLPAVYSFFSHQMAFLFPVKATCVDQSQRMKLYAVEQKYDHFFMPSCRAPPPPAGGKTFGTSTSVGREKCVCADARASKCCSRDS